MRQLKAVWPLRMLNPVTRILLSLGFCIGLSGSIQPVTAGGLGGLLNAIQGATGSDSSSGSGSGLGNLLKQLPNSSGSSGSSGSSTSFGSMLQQAREMEEMISMGPVDRHYIGRLSAAQTVSEYGSKMYSVDTELVRYVHSIMLTLAQHSRIPYVYDEFVPILIPGDDVNAFAVSGGFIIVLGGMLDLVENEDEMAYLLAHEIAHIELNHGLSVIANKKSGELFGKLMGDMTGAGESMSEFVSSMIDSAENGYDQDVEAEADARGLVIAQQAGYNPRAALTVMAKLKSKKGHYGGESYPPDRVARIRKKLNSVPYLGREESIGLRTARFQTVWARKP